MRSIINASIAAVIREANKAEGVEGTAGDTNGVIVSDGTIGKEGTVMKASFGNRALELSRQAFEHFRQDVSLAKEVFLIAVDCVREAQGNYVVAMAQFEMAIAYAKGALYTQYKDDPETTALLQQFYGDAEGSKMATFVSYVYSNKQWMTERLPIFKEQGNVQVAWKDKELQFTSDSGARKALKTIKDAAAATRKTRASASVNLDVSKLSDDKINQIVSACDGDVELAKKKLIEAGCAELESAEDKAKRERAQGGTDSEVETIHNRASDLASEILELEAAYIVEWEPVHAELTRLIKELHVIPPNVTVNDITLLAKCIRECVEGIAEIASEVETLDVGETGTGETAIAQVKARWPKQFAETPEMTEEEAQLMLEDPEASDEAEKEITGTARQAQDL